MLPIISYLYACTVKLQRRVVLFIVFIGEPDFYSLLIWIWFERYFPVESPFTYFREIWVEFELFLSITFENKDVSSSKVFKNQDFMPNFIKCFEPVTWLYKFSMPLFKLILEASPNGSWVLRPMIHVTGILVEYQTGATADHSFESNHNLKENIHSYRPNVFSKLDFEHNTRKPNCFSTAVGMVTYSIHCLIS